jgi:hypothetical protein
MDGTTRLLIVGGVVALVVYFGWPYFKGEMVSIGRQLSGDNRGVPPPGYERFGEYPNRDGDRGEGGRRLPPGVGNANGDPWAGKRQDRYPLMDRKERPPRWQDCRATSIWSDKLQCGPWQDGVPPTRGGGRW